MRKAGKQGIMHAPMLAMALVAVPAAAEGPFQDLNAIDRAVAGFTGRPVGVEGGAATPVDVRLRLASCPTLALSWRQDNHDAVVVRCSAPEWRLYVPVVAAPPAPAPATAPAPAPPPKPVIVIKRGDPVSVEVRSAGFLITRDGVAMNDAAEGARLLVNVDGPKKPIQAIALEPGRATLPGFGPGPE